MASKRLRNFLIVGNGVRSSIFNRVIHLRIVFPYSTGHQSCPEDEEGEEEILPSEWYEKAFSKMKRWSHSLKEVDMIGGRLVGVNDHSRVLDHRLEQKMHAFKSIARIFIGYPSVQETMRKNLMALSDSNICTEFQFFSNRNEREALTVSSLAKVADILSISAQQRKVIRQTICPQVTQNQIWTGALVETLNGLKFEIDFFVNRNPSKEMRLAKQIVVGCLKFLDSATRYDSESTSWMRLKPTRDPESPASHKWEDVLEMSVDLINCLCDEKDVAFHVSKLELMKEGLYQIRDVLIDKNIGYKENRYQESLVQKKLTKNLGHPSRCLFTLLLYYLYGSVGDIEVDLRGGVQPVGGGKFCLYMGKILTVDEEMVLWNGVKQLDRALGLLKFVWEASGMKGDLELQGHLWCVGADRRSFPYRGNMYFLHGINL